jgi:hypothetical protein|tara:strand:- start:32 stop:262 length:231 start_codon:yes stop_codon:yes gene_type:complete
MSFQEEVSVNLRKLVDIQTVLAKKTTESNSIIQGTHIPIFRVPTHELGYIRVGQERGYKNVGHVLNEVIQFLESYE